MLGLLIGAAAEAMPAAEWGSLLCVCRRWHRVGAAALRQTATSLRPRFVVPAAIRAGAALNTVVLSHSHTSATLSARVSSGEYSWAFVAPQRLKTAALCPALAAVRFRLSQYSQVYVGVFAGLADVPPEPELHWTPHFRQESRSLPRDLCAVTVGCCSGALFHYGCGRCVASVHSKDFELGSGSGGGFEFDIVLDPRSLQVTFAVNEAVLWQTRLFVKVTAGDEEYAALASQIAAGGGEEGSADVRFCFGVGMCSVDTRASASFLV